MNNEIVHNTSTILVGPVFITSLIGDKYREIDSKLEHGLLDNRSVFEPDHMKTIQKTITLDGYSKRLLFVYKAIYRTGHQSGVCSLLLSKCCKGITDEDISIVFQCPIHFTMAEMF